MSKESHATHACVGHTRARHSQPTKLSALKGGKIQYEFSKGWEKKSSEDLSQNGRLSPFNPPTLQIIPLALLHQQFDCLAQQCLSIHLIHHPPSSFLFFTIGPWVAVSVQRKPCYSCLCGTHKGKALTAN